MNEVWWNFNFKLNSKYIKKIIYLVYCHRKPLYVKGFIFITFLFLLFTNKIGFKNKIYIYIPNYQWDYGYIVFKSFKGPEQHIPTQKQSFYCKLKRFWLRRHTCDVLSSPLSWVNKNRKLAGWTNLLSENKMKRLCYRKCNLFIKI